VFAFQKVLESIPGAEHPDGYFLWFSGSH